MVTGIATGSKNMLHNHRVDTKTLGGKIWPIAWLTRRGKLSRALKVCVRCKATCTQDAWLRMAEIYDALGLSDRAVELREKARILYYRFNETFWDDDLSSYIYGLDHGKRKIRTIASNMGHCLWSGIVPRERAFKVAERLMREDMSSGWGIRTLSADNPAFNPFSYHNGSIWPHDNSLIACGLKRYELVKPAETVLHDVCDAATHFQCNQLPEFYAGIQRTPCSRSNLMGKSYYVSGPGRHVTMTSDFPVQCYQASVPQAWAAGSTFLFLQTMLGLHADSPNHCVYVDPCLPDWLHEVTISNLRIGEGNLSLRFWRDDHTSHFEVIEGTLSVSRRPYGNSTKLLEVV